MNNEKEYRKKVEEIQGSLPFLGSYEMKKKRRFRLNIFTNGDFLRQKGKVIILDEEQLFDGSLKMSDLITDASSRLGLPLGGVDKRRVYNEKGAEITDLNELFHDDVLFFTEGQCDGDQKFSNVLLQMSLKESMSCEATKQTFGLQSKSILTNTSGIPTNLLLMFKQINSSPFMKFDDQTKKYEVKKPTNHDEGNGCYDIDKDSTEKVTSNDSFELALTSSHCKISDIKEKLSKQWLHVHPSDITLISQGKQLLDERTANDYFAVEYCDESDSDQSPEKINAVVFVLVKPFVLYIKSQHLPMFQIDNSLGFNLSNRSSVSYLKMCIFKKALRLKKVKADYSLILDGKVMLDSKYLCDYNVCSGSVIYLS